MCIISQMLRNNLEINSRNITFDANKYSQRLCGYDVQVVSGPIGREVVHFLAPPASDVNDLMEI